MEEKTKEKHKSARIKTRAVANFFVCFSLLLVSFSVGSAAQAAALYISPSAGSYNVGKTFSVTVGISSADRAVNAASGAISFPQDKLEITALSKTGSIFSLWVQEPVFNNSAGTVSFEGIVLNPGFTGASGKILGVTFRVKAAGAAPLNFSSGSVLANDGKGTNILSSLGSASFALEVPVTGPAAPEATTPVPAAGVPAAPQVSSSTHPDPNRWYAKKTATFSWLSSSGITGVNVLADRNPNTDPGTRSDGLFSAYTYEDVEEGTWYFHLRLRNARGWGAISHFRFQIDTTPPDPFVITFPEGKESEIPSPPVRFSAADAASGIEYYVMTIGEQDAVRVRPEEMRDGIYKAIAPQEPGPHTLVIQAFDYAGNVTVAAEEFTVRSLTVPEITRYPSELPEGEALKVAGKAYPNSRVSVVVVAEDGREEWSEAESDQNGAFVLIWPTRLKAGLYTIAAQVTDSRGAKSERSAPLTILARQRPLLRVGSLVVTYLSVVITLLALLFLLAAILIYAWYRFTKFRKKIRKEVSEVEAVLHASFKTLRGNIGKQIQLLERAKTKRELTTEETKLIRQLKRDFDEIERVVQKELSDVEKEVR
ncbi:hypothetical protein HYW17_05930 [Candidatus Uhrbacteria bacterium]|nr:hypothetical protein [Candidatus Uhrbacteria bacterium]